MLVLLYQKIVRLKKGLLGSNKMGIKRKTKNKLAKNAYYWVNIFTASSGQTEFTGIFVPISNPP
jgi:hypothetical protein